ncbi:MAG TPA: metallophosphoesterase [Verrucomicrobiae bacterium]|jgi:hypothetical protein
MFRILVVLSLLLWSCGATGQKAPATAQFGVISDCHFDPFLYPDQTILALANTPDVSKWKRILLNGRRPQVNYGSDSDLILIQAALQSLHHSFETQPPLFILAAGDFLGHNFENKCNEHRLNYPSFALRTEEFVASLFADEFSDCPVFPTLGNNDTDNGHNKPPKTNSTFLREVALAWSRLVWPNNDKEAADFVSHFSQDGWYECDSNATKRPIHLFVLNSSLMTGETNDRYVDYCDQLSWVSNRVSAMSEPKAWLLFHIPPGIDSFAFLRDTNHPINLWNLDRQREFLAWLGPSAKIAEIVCGHTHRDEFRALFRGSKADRLIRIAPSIGPNTSNNPAFKIYSVTAAGDIVECQTFFSTDFKTFVAEYQQSDVSIKAIYPPNASSETKQNFARYYGAQSRPGNRLIQQHRDNYWNVVLHLDIP